VFKPSILTILSASMFLSFHGCCETWPCRHALEVGAASDSRCSSLKRLAAFCMAGSTETVVAYFQRFRQ
jgi:hypothetical protein